MARCSGHMQIERNQVRHGNSDDANSAIGPEHVSIGLVQRSFVLVIIENPFPLVSHLSAIDHELKLKVQELRLYETVLMQRIHALKAIANDTATPDVKVRSSSLHPSSSSLVVVVVVD